MQSLWTAGNGPYQEFPLSHPDSREYIGQRGDLSPYRVYQHGGDLARRNLGPSTSSNMFQMKATAKNGTPVRQAVTSPIDPRNLSSPISRVRSGRVTKGGSSAHVKSKSKKKMEGELGIITRNLLKLFDEMGRTNTGNFYSINVSKEKYKVQVSKTASKSAYLITKSVPDTDPFPAQTTVNRVMAGIYEDLHVLSTSGIVKRIEGFNKKVEGNPLISSLTSTSSRRRRTQLLSTERVDLESHKASPKAVEASRVKISGDQIYDEVNRSITEIFSVIEKARLFSLYHPFEKIESPSYFPELEDDGLLAAAAVCELSEQDPRVQKLADRASQEILRYGEMARTQGWLLLGICACSPSFRRACQELPEKLWKSLCEKIGDNGKSLEFFARIRGVDPHVFLREIPGIDVVSTFDDNPQITKDHPHNWFIPQDGSPQRPMHKKKLQVNIDQNRYSPAKFRGKKAPAAWPTPVAKWPSDPSALHVDKAPCEQCGAKPSIRCSCDPAQNFGPLVEIFQTDNTGLGVRALQDVASGTTLGEYIGEYVPAYHNNNSVYSLEMHTLRHSYGGNKRALAMVDSAQYGNWTRFMNHSCDAHARFETARIGARVRVVVKAEKDIKIFEEITVDYGPSYFGPGKAGPCCCGAPNCRYVDKTTKKDRMAKIIADEEKGKKKEAKILKRVVEKADGLEKGLNKEVKSRGHEENESTSSEDESTSSEGSTEDDEDEDESEDEERDEAQTAAEEGEDKAASDEDEEESEAYERLV